MQRQPWQLQPQQQQQQPQQQQHQAAWQPHGAASAPAPGSVPLPPGSRVASAGGAPLAAATAAATAQQQLTGPGAAPIATPGTASGAAVLAQKYEILSKIGEGTYGLVYLAAARDGSRRLYAIKTFKTGREGDGVSPTAIREIGLLRELRHPNIVRLEAVHINRADASISLAFDYAEHDMYEMIWHHRDRLQAPMDPYTVKSMLWQLLKGLSYMHQNWIIHRDLKPSNVLVTGDGPEPGVVKIADFGLARIFQAPVRPLYDNGVVVTIWYRAPELLLGARHYTRALDMWAAGCIFAELMTLRPLFQGSERKAAGAPFQFDQVDRIFRVLGHPSPKAWPLLESLPHWHENTENVRARRPEWGDPRLAEHLAEVLHAQAESARAQGRADAVFRPSPACLDLLRRMLEYDPLRRITAEDALRHEYFTAEAPLPGPNAFVCNGATVASYPRRNRAAVQGLAAGVTGGGAVGAAAGGSAAPTAAAAAAVGAGVAAAMAPVPPMGLVPGVAGGFDPSMLTGAQVQAPQYLQPVGAVGAAGVGAGLPLAAPGVSLGYALVTSAAPAPLGMPNQLMGVPGGLGLHPGAGLGGALPGWAPAPQQPAAALYQHQYAAAAAAPSAPLVLRGPIAGLPPGGGPAAGQRPGAPGQQQGSGARRGSRTDVPPRYNPY